MGTEMECPSGPARIVGRDQVLTNPYHGPMPALAKLALLMYCGLLVIVVLAGILAGRTGSALAEAIDGRCYRTGIGAVGMADFARGTNRAHLIFPSGVRESYDIRHLREVACPNTAIAE